MVRPHQAGECQPLVCQPHFLRNVQCGLDGPERDLGVVAAICVHRPGRVCLRRPGACHEGVPTTRAHQVELGAHVNSSLCSQCSGSGAACEQAAPYSPRRIFERNLTDVLAGTNSPWTGLAHPHLPLPQTKQDQSKTCRPRNGRSVNVSEICTPCRDIVDLTNTAESSFEAASAKPLVSTVSYTGHDRRASIRREQLLKSVKRGSSPLKGAQVKNLTSQRRATRSCARSSPRSRRCRTRSSRPRSS